MTSPRPPLARRIARASPLVAVLLVMAPVIAAGAGPGGSPPSALQVRLRDARVTELTAALDGVPPQDRARAASEALAAAFAAGARGAQVTARGERAEVRLGDKPVLVVGPDDAAAATLPDAAALGAVLAARIDVAVAEEAFRVETQGIVYSVSMLVFSALLAFLLARRLGSLALATAGRVESGELGVPALSVGGMELVSAEVVRGGVPLVLRLGRFGLQLAVLYGWILFATSLFERTRALGERLTRALVGPAAALLAQLGQALPLAVVLAIAVAALAIVLRAVRLHFEGLAREDGEPGWLRPELARSTGLLVRIAVVIVAVIAAPDLLGVGTGNGLRVLAFAALVAAGLGAAPLAAALLLGTIAVYGGALRRGDEAEVGGRRGRVKEVTLREIVLEEEGGATVRVSHLLTLVHPTRLLSQERGRRR